MISFDTIVGGKLTAHTKDKTQTKAHCKEKLQNNTLLWFNMFCTRPWNHLESKITSFCTKLEKPLPSTLSPNKSKYPTQILQEIMNIISLVSDFLTFFGLTSFLLGDMTHLHLGTTLLILFILVEIIVDITDEKNPKCVQQGSEDKTHKSIPQIEIAEEHKN